jgi:hypothetical protein
VRAILLLVAALAGLGGCAAQGEHVQSSGSEAALKSDREQCADEARLKISAAERITFGGFSNANPVMSSGAFTDCMLARGHKAEAIGDVYGSPNSQSQIGN